MYKKRMDAYKTLHDSAMEVINDRLNGRTKSKDGHPDVLDRMLNTIDRETNEKMDITMIHDSTSSLLTSLVYMLTQHPEVEDKIREEVETVIGEGVPNMENIKKLSYTMAVIKETLRLFPPAVALIKTCIKDTSLGPWEIKEGARKSFQAFPLYIENALCSAGAEILCRRGVADEEKDINGDIHSWVDLEFWPSAFEFVGLDPKTSGKSITIDRYCDDALDLVVTDSNELSCHLLRSSDNKFATVILSRELQSPNSGRSTRHIEFKLSKNMDYCVGNHLAIFPENDPELVLRFGSLIDEHDLGRVVTVTAASNNDKAFRHLPLGI